MKTAKEVSSLSGVEADLGESARSGAKEDFLDIVKLVRSIQRAEGNPDCFSRAQGYCDQLGCAWRQYCLEDPQQLQHEQKGHEDEQSVVCGHKAGFQDRHNNTIRREGNYEERDDKHPDCR